MCAIWKWLETIAIFSRKTKLFKYLCKWTKVLSPLYSNLDSAGSVTGWHIPCATEWFDANNCPFQLNLQVETCCQLKSISHGVWRTLKTNLLFNCSLLAIIILYNHMTKLAYFCPHCVTHRYGQLCLIISSYD